MSCRENSTLSPSLIEILISGEGFGYKLIRLKSLAWIPNTETLPHQRRDSRWLETVSQSMQPSVSPASELDLPPAYFGNSTNPP
jgi:hypothetical protein